MNKTKRFKLIKQFGILFSVITISILVLINIKKEDFIYSDRLPPNTLCAYSNKPVDYRFAVQLKEKGKDTLFFASFGYFLKYIEKDNYKFYRAYVMDYSISKNYETEKWINARVAFYLKSDIKTPDESGWIAFIEKKSAENLLKSSKKQKIYTFIEIIRTLRGDK